MNRAAPLPCLALSCALLLRLAPAQAAPPASTSPGVQPSAGTAAATQPEASAPAVALPQAASQAPGYVDIQADATLTLDLQNGRATTHFSLHPGSNHCDLATGTWAIGGDATRLRALPNPLVVVAGQGTPVTVLTLGLVGLDSTQAPGSTAEIESKILKLGEPMAALPAGPHSVVLRQPGHVPGSANFVLTPGSSVRFSASLAPQEPHARWPAWTAIALGASLLAGAAVLDRFSKFDGLGGDFSRFTLVGVGAAGIVTGTLLAKHWIDQEDDPTPQPIDLKLFSSFVPDECTKATADRSQSAPNQ